MTFCIASAATAIGVVGDEHEDGFGALGQLVIGVGVGATVAFIGGRLMFARQRGWMQHGSRRLATLALALLAFLVASQAGGTRSSRRSSAGSCSGRRRPPRRSSPSRLTELAGSLLSLVLWFIFGAGFVIPAFEDLDVRIAVYAIASLTVVRMVPVAPALLGAGQGRPTVAFIGWFGRGLASVVFALLTVEELGDTDPWSSSPSTRSPSRSCSASSLTASRPAR